MTKDGAGGFWMRAKPAASPTGAQGKVREWLPIVTIHIHSSNSPSFTSHFLLSTCRLLYRRRAKLEG